MIATREPEVDKNEYSGRSKRPIRVIKTEGFERLFSHFTGLHGDELMQYVKEFQAKALQIYPYSCISNGGFAALRERAHSEYLDIIDFAKNGGKIVLDLGCCLGTDIREFLLDGGDADGSNTLIAVDLRQDFIDLGQNLFKGPTPGIEFRATDLLDSADTNLDDVKGKVTLLYTGAVFHLFEEDQQRAFAENIKSLLATEGEVAAFGWHRGSKEKGPRLSRSGNRCFTHDPQSWKELWTEVLGVDAINWTIRAELRHTWTAAENVSDEHPVLEWSLWRK